MSTIATKDGTQEQRGSAGLPEVVTMESRFAEVNGTRLHYRIRGSGSPIVLLHGDTQTGHMWTPLVPSLAGHHTVIVPDSINPRRNPIMNQPLWNTQNDLAEKVRRDAIALLNQELADALDLALQAKQAHWNVKGPNFIALHELFDEVVDKLFEHADDLAERAVELGGTAYGTARVAAKSSRLPEYPLGANAGREHVAALSAVIAKFAASARAGIDAATGIGDADTADLFTEISRGVDKLLWKVEAHAQGKD